jgi:glycosyltransferase involved in cell wall biosynthesis
MNEIMIVSAQPDEQYFHWQLDIQLHNLKKHNKDKQYVILLGVFKGNTLSSWAKERISEGINIVVYEINLHKYVPALRFELLSQYYKQYNVNGELSAKSVLYIDSDVIFREWLDETQFANDSTVYMSDCNSYLNYDYIASKGRIKNEEDLLDKLCLTVGIRKDVVKANNNNSGGCHYYFKPNTVNEQFWLQCLSAVHNFYNVAEDYRIKREEVEGDYHALQSWCADMWIVLWTLWKNNVNTELSNELNFTWATDKASMWNVNKIYHNAGIDASNTTSFNKLHFKEKSPLVRTHNVDTRFANWWYVKEINEIVTQQPLITVVTLTSNRPIELQEAYKCFVSFNYPNKEWLVINNNSELTYRLDEADYKADIPTKFSSVRILNYAKTSGIGDVINKAIPQFRGDYVHFMDDNDLRLPQTLFILKQAFSVEEKTDRVNNVVHHKRTLAVLPTSMLHMENFVPLQEIHNTNAGKYAGLYKREYFNELALPKWVCVSQDYMIATHLPDNTRDITLKMTPICYQLNNGVYRISGKGVEENEETAAIRMKEYKDNHNTYTGHRLLTPTFRKDYFADITAYWRKKAGIIENKSILGRYTDAAKALMTNVQENGISAVTAVVDAVVAPVTEQSEKRLAICKSNECMVYTDGFCGKGVIAGVSCGCELVKKVKNPNQHCPQNRW